MSTTPTTFVITERTIVAVSRALALDLYPIDEILRTYNLSHDDFTQVRNSVVFKRCFEDAVLAWNDANSAEERLRVKALIMLEEWLPDLNSDLTDRASPLSSRIRGGELLMKLAGVDQSRVAEHGLGERFSVTINMGEKTSKIIDAQVLPAQVRDESNG